MKLPGKMIPEVLKTILKRPVTVRYPYEKTEIPPDFRGKIVFEASLCIGCKMCMRDCPTKAITIERVPPNLNSPDMNAINSRKSRHESGG
jgi:formate hydrogenlyase subunit 6/NADH:ubiquinone oxidoreductase subunit I